MQCHVLGVTMLPIVGALLVADARSRTGGPERRRVLRFGLGGLAIVVLQLRAAGDPRADHELLRDQRRARLHPVGRRPGRARPAGAVPRHRRPGRVVAADRPVHGRARWPACSPRCVVIAIVVGARAAGHAARAAGRALARSRAAVDRVGADVHLAEPRDGDPGPAQRPLPRLRRPDGVHARRAGSRGAVACATPRRATRAAPCADADASPAPLGCRAVRADRPGRRGRLVALLVAFNLVNQPPAVHPDGGFPAAEAAGARILAATGAGTPITLRSLPDFKSTEAYAYPLVRAGASVRADTGSGPVVSSDGALVVICDSPVRGGDRRAVRRPRRGDGRAARPVRRARRPLPGRARPDDLGLSGRARVGSVEASAPGIANAGAPDAGVRCPETRTVEGESGSCPGVCSVTPRFPAR